MLENGLASEPLSIINHKLNTLIRMQQEIQATFDKMKTKAVTDTQTDTLSRPQSPLLPQSIFNENTHTTRLPPSSSTPLFNLRKSTSSCIEHVWDEIKSELTAFVQKEKESIDAIMPRSKQLCSSQGMNKSIFQPYVHAASCSEKSHSHQSLLLQSKDTLNAKTSLDFKANSDDTTENLQTLGISINSIKS